VDDLTGTDSVDTSAEIPTTNSGPVDGGAPATEEGGGNPAWESLRTKLDPISFKAIEEDLKGWDKNAESRISNLNSQLKSYKDLGEVDQLQSYASLAQQIDSNPEAIYEALGNFLRQNGRLPETEAEMQEALDETESNGQEYRDPRLDQLEQQQEQMREFLAQQEQMRVEQEADVALEQEIGQLQQTHPDFTDDDIQEVLMRAAFELSNGSNRSLDEIAQEYIEKTVNRIRAVPRPGDTAPRLLPTSGGVPTSNGQATPLGKMSRSDVQSLIAASLQQGV
jgi:tetratricopeptide (TPR) repeat protein